MSEQKPATDTAQSTGAAQVAAALAEAEGWTPKDGDEIQGEVVTIKMGHSDHKEKAGRDPRYPIVFIRTADGKITAVHCFQSILENEVKNYRPMPGETVYIKRIGVAKASKPGQNPPIRYAVYVERDNAQTADVWGSMSG